MLVAERRVDVDESRRHLRRDSAYVGGSSAPDYRRGRARRATWFEDSARVRIECPATKRSAHAAARGGAVGGCRDGRRRSFDGDADTDTSTRRGEQTDRGEQHREPSPRGEGMRRELTS